MVRAVSRAKLADVFWQPTKRSDAAAIVSSFFMVCVFCFVCDLVWPNDQELSHAGLAMSTANAELKA